jgi:quercetin dioxygenase-like cupin family protein
MVVRSWDQNTDGPLSEKSLRAKLESLGYSVHRYVYPPGTYFGPHTHDVDKIDAVLEGEFLITSSGQKIVLKTGDYVEVPRGTVHSAEVVGVKPVVSLDAMKTH